MTTLLDVVEVRCTFEGGCGWLFEGEREEAVESAVWHREQVHGVPAPASGRLPLSGGYGFEVETKEAGMDGLVALERMDRGESQEPLGEGEPRGDERLPTAPSAGHSAAASDVASSASSPSPNGRARGSKYTRETLIAAIKEYGAEHGHAPSQRPGDIGQRLVQGAKSIGLSWPDLVEEAGFERPARGRISRPLGAAEPARATGATAARPDAAPSGSTEETGRSKGGGARQGSATAARTAGAAAHSPGGASQKKPKTTAVTKTQIPKPAETPDLRDPIRTADIPYDADRLEDEAAFLRRRADAMNELAAALRKFEEISSSD